MTDNEIIKALGCCPKAEMTVDCKALGCPVYQKKGCGYVLNCDLDSTTDAIIEGLSKDALDLINRQKAEIEALIAGQETLQRYISTAKAEAVKEFAERLCKDRVSNDPVVIAVKVELKTAGEENGEI